MLFIVVGLAIYFLIHKKYKKAVILIVSFVIFAVLMYFGLPFFIGKKYIFTVIGFRIPVFSEYENIIKYSTLD